MEIYQRFNEAYGDFIHELHKSFPELKRLALECDCIDRAMAKDFATKRIYNWIHEGYDARMSKMVYSRDVDLMNRAKNHNRITLFERTDMYELFPRLDPQEREYFWKGLECIVQHLALISGTSSHLEAFTDLANIFVANNPQIDDTNPQAITRSMTEQLFTNPELAARAVRMVTEKESGIRDLHKGFKTVLTGLNVDGTQPVSAEQSQLLAAMCQIGDAKAEASSADEGPSNPLFAGLNQSEREISTETKQVHAQNQAQKKSIVDCFDALDSTQESKLREFMTSTMGPNADPTKKSQLASLYQVMYSGDKTKGREQLRANFGATDAECDLFETFSKQMQGMQSTATRAAAGMTQKKS